MSQPSLFARPPPPKTRLGWHRQLAPLAGIHVSPLCLGAMSIGDKWDKFGFGAMDKEGSFKLLDAFYEAGGNFIDTANNYQDESSEEFIGEWMEARGVRDQMVIATKVRALSVVARRSLTLILTFGCVSPAVLREHDARGRRRRAEGALRGEQHQVDDDLARGVAQEAAHALRRHLLRPLRASPIILVPSFMDAR